MSFEKFLLKSEDEMDFLPIIPLNESDQENPNGIEIPSEIALLPLRNTVLFPGVVLPITVGREPLRGDPRYAAILRRVYGDWSPR